MAVIEKIRSKGGLLIGIVGFSLLAFLLGDLFSSQNGLFSSNEITAGEIAGSKVNAMDFEAKVEVQANNYKMQTNSDNIDQNTMDQIREQTWGQLVEELVFKPQYEKLGLSCSAVELVDMVQGKNPHPQIKQAFTDPKTGTFNPANVANFLKNMDNDQTGRTRNQWLLFEKAIREERVKQKYSNLIRNGVFVSKAEAAQDFMGRSKGMNIRYVMVPYSSISDSSIEVSDADLKTLYNATSKKYKQEAMATVDYVMFDITPTDIDRQAASFAINKLADEFRSAASDSAFVVLNSDGSYNSSFNKKGTLSPMLDSIMFSSAVGFTYGPYEEGNSYKVAKLSAVKMIPDSVKASHILLAVGASGKDAVLAQADSIKKALEGGASFQALSDQYSTDQVAKGKGGDLGWFSPGMMVQPFNDACFQGKKGDYTLVETQFGIHVIHITDQGKLSRQINVAYLEKKIEPSSKTYQAVYQKANQFAAANATAESFDAGVTSTKLTKLTESNIMSNARMFAGMENSREVVRWAHTNEPGSVSKAYEFGSRFVIAKLVDRREKGIGTMDQVRDQLTAEVRRDKKAEQIKAKLSKGGSLESLASANGQQVLTADNVLFASPYLPSSGMEPYLVGALTNVGAGKTTSPIKGMNGVYVVQVVSVADVKAPADLSNDVKQSLMQLQSRSQYEVESALREKAGIVDNRYKFY